MMLICTEVSCQLIGFQGYGDADSVQFTMDYGTQPPMEQYNMDDMPFEIILMKCASGLGMSLNGGGDSGSKLLHFIL